VVVGVEDAGVVWVVPVLVLAGWEAVLSEGGGTS